MARKIIDTYPVFTITVGMPTRRFEYRPMSREEAQDAQAEFGEMLNDLQAQTARRFDVESRLAEEAHCAHCNAIWTETSPNYNGGCCGLDEANSPERLSDLQLLIVACETEDFYRYDPDRGRDRVKVDWPWALAGAVDTWLKAGRPPETVNALMSLAKRVKSSDWCTVWEDPGPSDAALARLPDRVSVDLRPEQLADELCSLLDDMNLLPARAA